MAQSNCTSMPSENSVKLVGFWLGTSRREGTILIWWPSRKYNGFQFALLKVPSGYERLRATEKSGEQIINHTSEDFTIPWFVTSVEVKEKVNFRVLILVLLNAACLIHIR